MSTADEGARSTRPRPESEDVWGRRAALVVGLVGLVVVIIPSILHIGQVFGDDPFSSRTQSVTVVREVDGKQERETTTSPEEQTVIDRALSSGGLLLLRVGVVAVASFLAGATVQRIIAGDFSGKFGPLELRKVSKKTAAASSATVEEMARDIAGQMALVRRTARVALEAARRVDGVDRRLSAETAKDLDKQAAATRRATRLASETARRLRDLEARIPDTTDT